MKMGMTILMLGFLALGGCSQARRSEVKEEAKESVGITRTDFPEKKTRFIGQSERRIRDIAADLARLENTDLKKGRMEKLKAKVVVKDAKDILEDAREELDDLRDADADEWQDEQQDFLSKMNRLEERFTTARNYYH